MPAYMRCAYRCDKEATEWKGDENREKLAQSLKEQALAVPDKEDKVQWVPGTIRSVQGDKKKCYIIYTQGVPLNINLVEEKCMFLKLRRL